MLGSDSNTALEKAAFFPRNKTHQIVQSALPKYHSWFLDQAEERGSGGVVNGPLQECDQITNWTHLVWINLQRSAIILVFISLIKCTQNYTFYQFSKSTIRCSLLTCFSNQFFKDKAIKTFWWSFKMGDTGFFYWFKDPVNKLKIKSKPNKKQMLRFCTAYPVKIYLNVIESEYTLIYYDLWSK